MCDGLQLLNAATCVAVAERAVHEAWAVADSAGLNLEGGDIELIDAAMDTHATRVALHIALQRAAEGPLDGRAEISKSLALAAGHRALAAWADALAHACLPSPRSYAVLADRLAGLSTTPETARGVERRLGHAWFDGIVDIDPVTCWTKRRSPATAGGS
jgi:hypothetical protein